MEAYDELGLRSGWRVLRCEQIWQINRQDNYVGDLQESIALINQGALTGLIDMPEVHLASLLALPSLALADILPLCQKERWFTGITLNFSSDPEIYGYLTAVTDESLTLATYSLAGKLEGEQTFYLSDVQSLVWQNYQFLVREKLALTRTTNVNN